MELVDIFSKDGEIIRRAVPKHEAKHAGEYSKHVLIIMKTSDSPKPGEGEGLYVVQQRSLKSKHFPGKWDMTGGGVISGETPIEAAHREVNEELLMDIPMGNLKAAFEQTVTWDDGTGLIVYVFMCRVDVPDDGFKFNASEVNDVKVMAFHEFYDYVMDHNNERFGEGLKEIERVL